MKPKKLAKRRPKPYDAEPAAQIDKETADRHVRGLLTRGEAARPKNGELPLDATHEIVEEREGELPRLTRRRFSAF